MTSWKTIQHILFENNLPISIYTLNAYILLFKDNNFFGNKECKEIDEWLTINYDIFKDNVKKMVIDYFIEKNGFAWLSSYCTDMKKMDLEYKKIRFATITDGLNSITDDPLKNFVELNDCFNLFVEKMKQPDFFYKVTSAEEIAEAIEKIKFWANEERLYIIKNSIS